MQLHSADSQVGVIVDRTSLELHYLLPAERAEDYVFCARLDYEDGPDNYNGVKLSRYGTLTHIRCCPAAQQSNIACECDCGSCVDV